MSRLQGSIGSVLALAWFSLACADLNLEDFEQALQTYAAGGDTAAGLREALEVGTANAVASTSAQNGFLDNPLIRIGLPDSFDSMATGLRVAGFGPQLDDFEGSMNRAAELASGEAKEVFWAGIRQMTFRDAQEILHGGDTAATNYFERTTRDDLELRFRPIVDAKLGETGVVRSYDALVGRYTAMPFAKEPSFEPRNYVTQKALDGLFTVLGEEETRIRTDPAARTSELLRQVFGSQ